jgi:hypothetical protein
MYFRKESVDQLAASVQKSFLTGNIVPNPVSLGGL